MFRAHRVSLALALVFGAAVSLAQQPAPATTASGAAGAKPPQADCVRPRAMHGTDKTSMPMPMQGPCPADTPASGAKPRPRQKQAINGR